MKTKKAEGGRLGLPLAAAFLRFPAPPPARSLQQQPHNSLAKRIVQPSSSQGKEEPSFRHKTSARRGDRSYLPSSFLEVSALPFMVVVAGARVFARGQAGGRGAFESAAEAEGGGMGLVVGLLCLLGVRCRVGVREREKAGTRGTGWVQHSRRVVAFGGS